MKRRRKRRKNPDTLGYWLTLGAIVVGAIAIAAWKAMGDKARTKALPVGGGPNDLAIGGPWTLLDVEQRSRAKDPRGARESLQKGDLVVLLLNAGGNVNAPFPVTIVGEGRDLLYNGMWALRPPASGPQFVDFGPEHVFQIG